MLGQITSAPEDATIRVGENINITCDTGTNVFIPTLLINCQSTDANSQVTDITPGGSPNKLKVFLFSAATRENNGIVFICSDTLGSLTLNVLCKLLYIIIRIDISL